MAELPSGTVTFLFTDVAGSTRLWQAYPDAMRSAMARHDDIVRAAIERHGGYVVKTTGDGFHAAFAAAHDAIDAAVAAQLALARETWSETGALVVRMGIHSGPADIRDGDYYGTAVNRAARLMSVAHGGQIVMSLATKELVQDREVELLDLGEHHLRDLARADHVFQVVNPELARDFPPLRSLDPLPGNLPLLTSSFVGRHAELAAVDTALESARLVTLVGVGGVGKTRLSLQAAAEVLPRFHDGAWCCELALAIDEDSLLQVVTSTLGVPPAPGTTPERSIVEFLRPKAALLLFDNCEHLLDEASRLVQSVLHECPQVRVLATSREGLGVPGEQMLAVRSLAVPRDDDTFSAIASSDAVALFVDRAAAARAGFVLDQANAGAVVEICQRLDGIPLALELAAARVATMNPRDIAAHVDERFRLLTGGRRTGIERHQTLRATVDWSYSLLEPAEQATFGRLGVFAGGFDADGAAAVVSGAGIEPWDVLDALVSLVAKSMVVLDDSVDGQARYHLLETLRAYARERLDEQDETDEWRRHHAVHFADLAERWGPELRGRGEIETRRRLRADLENVRAAITWGLDRADPDDQDLGVRILVALAYEVTMDRNTEYGAWAEHALAQVTRWPPGTRSVALGAAAHGAFHRGDFPVALRYAEEAGAETIPLAPGSLLGPVSWASALVFNGRADEALTVMEDAIRAFDVAGAGEYERWNLRAVLLTFRMITTDAGDVRSYADEALHLARRIGNPSALSISLCVSALAVLGDDPTTALTLCTESMDLTDSGASDVMLAITRAVASAACSALGDRPRALELVRSAIEYAMSQRDHGSLNFALSLPMLAVLDVASAQLALACARALDDVGSLNELAVQVRQQARDRARALAGADAYAELSSRVDGLAFEESVEVVLSELAAMTATDQLTTPTSAPGSRSPG